MALCSEALHAGVGPGRGPNLLPAPLRPAWLGQGAWGLLSRAFSPPGFLSAPRPLDGSVKLPAGWPRPPGWRQFIRCAGK